MGPYSEPRPTLVLSRHRLLQLGHLRAQRWVMEHLSYFQVRAHRSPPASYNTFSPQMLVRSSGQNFLQYMLQYLNVAYSLRARNSRKPFNLRPSHQALEKGRLSIS